MNVCAELMKKYLDAKDMNFTTGTTKKGDSVIEFPYKGKIAKMFFSGDDGHYLSIYVVYENVPKDKTVDTIIACNSLNVQYKWVTFYVDDDNDVVLHLDAILSPATAAEEAFELLVRMLNIGDEAKPVIMKAIYA
ncbi:MAG: YbjN domain-containing protein [Oscillospiraceae bacterium]|nr:YbjN domain-containing protein [Oscillospiraceae bacterium]